MARSHGINPQYSQALSSLTDVDAHAPTDGDALIWSESDGAWVAGSIAVSGDITVTSLIVSGASSDYDVRLYEAGANNYQLRTNDDGAGNQQDATKPSYAFVIQDATADRFSFYRRPAAGAYALQWEITASSHLVPGASVSYDLGTTSKRVRKVYAATLLDADTGELVSSSGTVSLFGSGSSWTQLNMYTGGTARWHIVSGGHFLAVADNTYDIGASGATRPRNVWVAGTIDAGGTIGSSSTITATGGIAILGAGATLSLNGVTRLTTSRPTWNAATTTVNRNAVANGTTLANLSQAVGTLINDLRTMGILG